MASFPASSWQSALIRKTTRRPRNNFNDGRGRVVSTITPRLYLSDLYSARETGAIERLGITHIVSAVEVDVRKDFGDRVTVMHVPIRDHMDTNIAEWFDKVVKFIKDALESAERHKVLVHCLQGISRSATLVCAYLVATTPMRSREAIAHVQAKRGVVAPNIGFRRQLADWERQFEDDKTRAARERRRKSRSMGVWGGTLSRWMGIARPTGPSKIPVRETQGGT